MVIIPIPNLDITDPLDKMVNAPEVEAVINSHLLGDTNMRPVAHLMNRCVNSVIIGSRTVGEKTEDEIMVGGIMVAEAEVEVEVLIKEPMALIIEGVATFIVEHQVEAVHIHKTEEEEVTSLGEVVEDIEEVDFNFIGF